MSVPLTHSELKTTAGLVEKNFTKPAGVVTIRKVAIHATENNRFAKVTAYLFDASETYYIALENAASKIAPNLGSIPCFTCAQRWPNDWKLHVGALTNIDGSKVHFLVEYHITPAKKRGWGE